MRIFYILTIASLSKKLNKGYKSAHKRLYSSLDSSINVLAMEADKDPYYYNLSFKIFIKITILEALS